MTTDSILVQQLHDLPDELFVQITRTYRLGEAETGKRNRFGEKSTNYGDWQVHIYRPDWQESNYDKAEFWADLIVSVSDETLERAIAWALEQYHNPDPDKSIMKVLLP